MKESVTSYSVGIRRKSQRLAIPSANFINFDFAVASQKLS